MGEELERMAHRDKERGIKGTNATFVMTNDDINCIPEDRVVMYVCIIIDFRLQKEDPNRACITAGSNLINTPGDLTTRTVDVTTSKILWNSIPNREGATFFWV